MRVFLRLARYWTSWTSLMLLFILVCVSLHTYGVWLVIQALLHHDYPVALYLGMMLVIGDLVAIVCAYLFVQVRLSETAQPSDT